MHEYFIGFWSWDTTIRYGHISTRVIFVQKSGILTSTVHVYTKIQYPHEYVTQLSHIYERAHEHSKIINAHKHGSYICKNPVSLRKCLWHAAGFWCICERAYKISRKGMLISMLIHVPKSSMLMSAPSYIYIYQNPVSSWECQWVCYWILVHVWACSWSYWILVHICMIALNRYQNKVWW